MKRKEIYILSATLLILSVVGFALKAEAKYDIKRMTPEVSNALDNRRGRFEAIKEFKKKGIIGENNRGYVELKGSDSEARNLVENENRDRKVIYRTIAEQNGLQDALETIEKVFAQVQRDKADPGEKIQTEDGNWTTK